MPKANKEGKILALGVAILLLVVAAVYLLLAPPEYPSIAFTSPENGPIETKKSPVALANSIEIAADHYDREILPGLTKATLICMLSAPRWTQFPDSITASLEPQPDNKSKKIIAKTQSGGRQIHFSHVPLGNWRLVIDPDGFERREMLITINETNLSPRAVLPLTEARYLKGIVLDSQNNPVSDMVVHVIPLKKIEGFSTRQGQTTTKSDGTFEIKGLPENIYRAQCGDYSFPLGEPKEIHLLGQEGWIELYAPQLGRLTVALFDEKTKLPAGKGQILIQRIGGQGNLGHTARATLKENGKVLFKHLPPGEYSLTVFSRIWHRRVQRCYIKNGQTTDLQIPLEAMN